MLDSVCVYEDIHTRTYTQERNKTKMKVNIDQIIKKKNPTGEDVGRLLLATLAYYLKKHEPHPNVTTDTINELEQRITKGRECYDACKAIYFAMINIYNTTKTADDKFLAGYYLYARHLEQALQAERDIKRYCCIPCVMTQTQYDRYKAKAEAKLSAIEVNYCDLIFDVVACSTVSPQTKAIAEALEACKEETPRARIITEYNRSHKIGYYTLKDGTRSDSMTDEEWEKAVKATQTKSWNDINYGADDVFFTGIKAIKKLYRTRTGEELKREDEAGILKTVEKFVQDIDADTRGDDALTLVKELVYIHVGADYTAIPTWHCSTEADGVTKYDIVRSVHNYYSAEQIEEFIADYPALYSAVVEYINERQPIKEIARTDYGKTIATRGELAPSFIEYLSLTIAGNADIAGTIDTTTPEGFIMAESILLTGIAIAKDTSIINLTEEKDYKYHTKTLYKFGADSVDDIYNSEITRVHPKQMRETKMMPAMKALYAWSEALEILSKVFNVDEFTECKLHVEAFEERARALLFQTKWLYAECYGSEQEKARKRAIIKELFPLVDLEKAKPKKANIKTVTDKLRQAKKADLDYIYSTDFEEVINILRG